MKVAKIKNNKKEEIIPIKEEYSVKKILVTIVIIIIIFLAFYFITTLVIKPINNKQNNSAVVIDSTKILLNHLLDRKEEEYFVLATKPNQTTINKINYSEIYNNYIRDYKSKENPLQFYMVDLNSALNKNFIGENTNITDNLSELKLNDEVLFKIKNGKIDEYYVGHSEIIKKLSNL